MKIFYHFFDLDKCKAMCDVIKKTHIPTVPTSIIPLHFILCTLMDERQKEGMTNISTDY